MYSTKKSKGMEPGFWDVLKVTFSMLTTLISWCECYILAHIKRNNHQIPFNLILLINAVSVIFFDDFLKLGREIHEWYSEREKVVQSDKSSPVIRCQSKNIPYPTQSHVVRDSPMGCFVEESPLLFSWYRATFPKDVKVTLFKNSLNIYKFQPQYNFFYE